MHLSRRRVGDSLSDALVRHVQHVGARQLREQEPAEMLGRAGAGRSIPQRARRFLRELDQLADRFCRQLRIDHENERHRSDQADRREILFEVELEIGIYRGRDEELRGQHHPRVAVGRRARHDLRAEDARHTGPRIDDDPLAPRPVEPLRHDLRDDIGTRARRAADDEPDRSFRIGWLRGVRRRHHQRCRNDLLTAA